MFRGGRVEREDALGEAIQLPGLRHVLTTSETIADLSGAPAFRECASSTAAASLDPIKLLLRIDPNGRPSVLVEPPAASSVARCLERCIETLSAHGMPMTPWIDVFALRPNGEVLWPCRETD